MTRPARDRACALLAALAVLVTLAGIHRGHRGDTAVFRDWYAETRASGALYRTARSDVNYPVLGALAAVAPGRVFRAALHRDPSPGEYHTAVKLLLVPCNALLALAGLAALRALRAPRAPRRALLLYALPSSWVLAGYFGQLDGLLFALQLGAGALGTRALTRAVRDPHAGRSLALAGLAALCAHTALLTKQLALFALPALLALCALPALAWHRRGRPREALAHLALAALSPLVLVAPDPFVSLPSSASPRSHLLFVFLGTGPAHGAMLGNGPSLWSFLMGSAEDPADAPFAPGLTPQRVGLALFVVAFSLVTLLGFRAIRRAVHALPPAVSARRSAALVLLAGGLQHLAMSLFVAGTHERYAGCAFPLLFVALARLAPRALPALAACASVYGLHVLSTLEWSAFAYAFPLRSPQLAACALALAGYVSLRPLVPARARVREGTLARQ